MFGRSKYDKLKRADVVDAICALEKQQMEMMERYDENKRSIDSLFKKGKAEKDKNMQIFYAKKIGTLQSENAQTGKRLSLLNANISALNSLKNAMDDKEFIENNSKLSLNELLAKPGELSKFVGKVTSKKMKREASIEQSLDIFETAQSDYVENESIYGIDQNTNEILALFEKSDEPALEDEEETEALPEKGLHDPLKE